MNLDEFRHGFEKWPIHEIICLCEMVIFYIAILEYQRGGAQRIYLLSPSLWFPRPVISCVLGKLHVCWSNPPLSMIHIHVLFAKFVTVHGSFPPQVQLGFVWLPMVTWDCIITPGHCIVA